MKLIKIQNSTRRGKKKMAVFSDGSKTHFGAKGMEDFTTHKNPERKKRYLKRHRPTEDWNKPKTAGALSRWILWNKPSLRASVADYKKRFGL